MPDGYDYSVRALAYGYRYLHEKLRGQLRRDVVGLTPIDPKLQLDGLLLGHIKQSASIEGSLCTSGELVDTPRPHAGAVALSRSCSDLPRSAESACAAGVGRRPHAPASACADTSSSPGSGAARRRLEQVWKL